MHACIELQDFGLCPGVAGVLGTPMLIRHTLGGRSARVVTSLQQRRELTELSHAYTRCRNLRPTREGGRRMRRASKPASISSTRSSRPLTPPTRGSLGIGAQLWLHICCRWADSFVSTSPSGVCHAYAEQQRCLTPQQPQVLERLRALQPQACRSH